MPSLSVALYRDVDVLVVGSSTAAVAASIEMQQAGTSAMLISDLPYVGSDFAGTLRLWPGDWTAADPLLQAAFAGSAPARPGAIKRSLEGALLAAGIPFLFQSRPIAILRDESGEIGGAILAIRSALLAVTCRAILDASEHGIVARLASLPVQERTGTTSLVEWTVLARDRPSAWPGELTELMPAFTFPSEKGGGEMTCRAFQLSLDAAALGENPMLEEHAARALLVDEAILLTADLLVRPPSRMVTPAIGAPRGRLADLSEEDLQSASGLWLLNSLLPVSAKGVGECANPGAWIPFARQLGRKLAAQVRPRAAGEAFHAQTGGDASGHYQFAPVFLRTDHGTLDFPEWSFPVLGEYDVVVSGGGTGGAPAGIAAARSGASTLVLETQHGLGGVGTLGLISAYWFGNRTGFTSELDREVSQYDAWSRSKGGSGWSPEVKSRVYQRLLRDACGDAWLGSFAFGVKMTGPQIDGLLVSTPFGSGLVRTRAVVDATGDSDVAAAAGAPCRLIGGEHLAVQGTGLSPRRTLTSQYQNSDHTFIDDTDPVGVTSAFVEARAKYPDAFDTVSIVSSRERRQIIGEIEISPLDILAGRTFPDTVYIARSNFDTHGFTVHPMFMMVAPGHDPMSAQVPYRCMVPRGIDGVLVTGLGMSAHRDALPLLRMQADVQNQGFAAGLAVAECARTGISPRHLDIRALQRKLVAIGIIEPVNLEQEDSFPLDTAALEQALAGDWRDLKNIAILLAHPEETRAHLTEILHSDEGRRPDAARILGMMGDPVAAPALAAIVRATPWDEGWDYQGMGQFGASMSWLDSVLIALGKTRASIAVDAIELKIHTLDENAAFSHCRAAALASAMMPHPTLARALEELLRRPGMAGHSITDLAALQSRATDNLIETSPRNLSLREVYLAMGLLLSGDPKATGRSILQSYTHDLRGHFARYAQALLAEKNHDALRLRIA